MRVVVGGVLVLAACGRISFDGSDARTQNPSDGAPDALAPDAAPAFVDSFGRADLSPLGNGWIEKTSGTYQVVSQQVTRSDFSLDYRNTIAVRPPSEDVLDVEVSIELIVGHIPPGYPQVTARLRA